MKDKKWYVHKPEIWDAKKCHKKARHLAKDGMGTKYPWRGYIGQFTITPYNGGCTREGEHYDGEIFPLPFIVDGFRLVKRLSWGYFIEEI